MNRKSKTRIRRLLSVLLCCLMLATLLPGTASAAEELAAEELKGAIPTAIDEIPETIVETDSEESDAPLLTENIEPKSETTPEEGSSGQKETETEETTVTELATQSPSSEEVQATDPSKEVQVEDPSEGETSGTESETAPPEETSTVQQEEPAAYALRLMSAEEDAEPSTTEVSGNIVWVNRNQQSSSQRPASVSLTLAANGTDTDQTLTVTAPSDNANAETWPFSFGDQPAVDENGAAISYTVKESPVSDYEITYSADTLTITNSYIGGKPSSHTFKHIDVRINGASLELQYVIRNADGTIISRVSDSITAYVTKVESVTINGTSYTGFTKSGSYEFRKTSGVSISSSSLTASSTAVLVVDLTDADGKAYDNVSITYGLGGIMDAAYECDGYRNGRFDGLDFVVGAAQNYQIEIASYGLNINVLKYIKTGNDSTVFSGTGREFSFLLTESENGKTTGRTWTIQNNASGTGTATITYPYDDLTGLEGYKDRTFQYTLSEVPGSDPQYTYDTTVHTFSVGFTISKEENASGGYKERLIPSIQETAYANGSFVFTNTVKTTAVRVTKAWSDGDNQDNIRPTEITVTLVKNGTPTRQTLELNADNNWTGSFTGLPVYENGQKISYSVKEQDVTGYTGIITGSQDNGYTITNTHTPETVIVSGFKTWNDNSNQDGARPDSITINLLKNGQLIESRTVTEREQWTWTFTDLPKYENEGTLITYSIIEDAVKDYSTSYSGYDVTNTHAPAQTSITVTKAWEDSSNKDGIRPDKVTIKLYADGTDTGKTLVLSKEQNWCGSFTNLEKYADGKLIEYTVQEEAVKDYQTEITGNMEKGFIVTNSHTCAPSGSSSSSGSSTSSTSVSPKTGDTHAPILWVVLILAAGLILTAAVYYFRKQNRILK